MVETDPNATTTLHISPYCLMILFVNEMNCVVNAGGKGRAFLQITSLVMHTHVKTEAGYEWMSR